MVDPNKKALALNFVVVSAISLVVLVVIISIFVASVDKHDEDLNDKSKTLFYCQCIYKQVGKDDYCAQTECSELGETLGIVCGSEEIAGSNGRIEEECGSYEE